MQRKIIALVSAVALAGCSVFASASSNLARLQTECSFAPLAEIGSSFIPYGGGLLNLTIEQACKNPQLIANDEAAIAAAIQALTAKKATP